MFYVSLEGFGNGYLADLKSHVTNKAQPEGFIAEEIWKELRQFFNKSKRNDDTIKPMNKNLFDSSGQVAGMTKLVELDEKCLKKAHRYVLLHIDEMGELKI
ncbi:hypothetical protein V2J09_004183 [Rumex salicifolius]